MIRTQLIIAFWALGALPLYALNAAVNWAAFKNAQQPEAYLEVYLYFSGKSLYYESLADSVSFQSYLSIKVTLSQNGKPVSEDVWQLGSPIYRNRLDISDLIDQRRYPVPYGDYQIEVEAQDLVRENNVFYFHDSLHVAFPDQGASLSEMALLWKVSQGADTTLAQFYKHGMVMLPQVHSFYPKSDSLMSFYLEAYQTESVGSNFLMRFFVEETEKPGLPVEGTVFYKKYPAAMVRVMLLQMPLKKIPSGNYRLVAEMLDGERKVVRKSQILFQRSNPDLDPVAEQFDKMTVRGTFVDTLSDESLSFALRAIEPIVRDYRSKQIAQLLEEKNALQQKQFLLSFWIKRSPINPYAGYQDYMALARYVDQRYRFAGRSGLRSDRGYVYLTYGKPDDVVLRENDADVFPYEIWTYLQVAAGTQSNVDFVFFNPTLTNGNFELLHSTARNERTNSNWRAALSKRNNMRQGGNAPANNNQRADDIWED